ncbi:hypothetical protein Q5752_003570 [Cryptotrichosporon argae]
MPPPAVTHLVSPSTSRPAHHVASTSFLPARIALPLPSLGTRSDDADPSSASASASASAADARPRPAGFTNPWASYRAASLSDAWLAYQRGAAIAPHALAPTRPASVSWDDCEPDPNLGHDDISDPLAQTSTAKPTKLKLYVRPELARVVSGDSADDWRDPPVRVVRPGFCSARPNAYADDGDDGEGPSTAALDAAEAAKAEANGRNKTSVTWLGHAGALVRVPFEDGTGHAGVLFDPIFSYRCSPSQYVGPARYLPPPCSVSELPDIHVCCISHDHYDHLDYYTIMDLWKYHRSTIHFFVPLGLAQWFTSSGIPADRVTELDWYDETLVSVAPTSSPTLAYPPTAKPPRTDPWAQSAETLVPSPADGTGYPPSARAPNTSSAVPAPAPAESAALVLKLAFTPAQHRSGRGLTDQMRSLWGSWCVGVAGRGVRASEPGMREWDGFKVFFGGDTGYRYATAPEDDPTAICPAFQDIADRYAPFSLALLPLSTGSSLPFLRSLLSLSLDQYTLTSSLHCSPADSLDIHRVIRARRSLGIHWGTFCDADEARGTRVEFGRCRRLKNVGHDWDDARADAGAFVVCDIGETLVFP